jgi:DNA-directed RNA polymerase beta' subunit
LIRSRLWDLSTPLKGAITIGITDMIIPEVKQKYLDDTDKKVEEIERHYRNGLYNREERKKCNYIGLEQNDRGY